MFGPGFIERLSSYNRKVNVWDHIACPGFFNFVSFFKCISSEVLLLCVWCYLVCFSLLGVMRICVLTSSFGSHLTPAMWRTRKFVFPVCVCQVITSCLQDSEMDKV